MKSTFTKDIQNFAIIIFLFCSTILYCQKDSIGVKFSMPYIDKEFHNSKVYYKGTDMQVSEDKLKEIRRNNPKLFLEKEIDDKGAIVRYWFDPNNQGTNTNFLLNAVTSESNFPNFKLTTISNEQIELSKLRGKIVIVRFELFANNFRFKKHEIQELDEKINALKNKDAVEAIIIFQCSKSEILEGFDLKNSNFKLVSDGRNFIQKYAISRFPSTLVIDQSGNLIGTFKDVDAIDLEAYIKN